MTKLLLTSAALAASIAAVALTTTTPARADANAPVCARIYDLGGSYQQCDFYNYTQCRATISGRGGECYDNPYLRNSLNQMPQRSHYRH